MKNTHELIINNTFTVKPQRQQQSGDQGENFFGLGGSYRSRGGGASIFGIPSIVVLAIIIAIAIAVIVIVIRRRKSRSTDSAISQNGGEYADEDNNDEDVESLIDDYQYSTKKNKETGSIGGKGHGS